MAVCTAPVQREANSQALECCSPLRWSGGGAIIRCQTWWWCWCEMAAVVYKVPLRPVMFVSGLCGVQNMPILLAAALALLAAAPAVAKDSPWSCGWKHGRAWALLLLACAHVDVSQLRSNCGAV